MSDCVCVDVGYKLIITIFRLGQKAVQNMVAVVRG